MEKLIEFLKFKVDLFRDLTKQRWDPNTSKIEHNISNILVTFKDIQHQSFKIRIFVFFLFVFFVRHCFLIKNKLSDFCITKSDVLTLVNDGGGYCLSVGNYHILGCKILSWL